MADWRAELGGIINGKGRSTRAEQENAQFEAFLARVVTPALRQLASELTGYGRDASIREAPASVVLTVRKEGLEEITFRVMKRYLSSGIVPYAEVRVAKGNRYAKYDASFRDTLPIDVDSVTEAEIIACFIKYYRMLHDGDGV